MEYREIVSVTGIGGLFQLIATKSDGAIVRSLADKSTKFIPARLHNVTPLESIEIYTTGENVRLHEVLLQMKEKTDLPVPDAKKADNNTIRGYFQEVFPELDTDRVYISDMKKMLRWFDILKSNDLLHFESLQEESNESADTGSVEETKEQAANKTEKDTGESEESKPRKTPKKKKAAPAENESAEAKPVKKTARKKKEED